MLFGGNKEEKIMKAVEKKNGAQLVKMVHEKDEKILLDVIAAMGKVGGDECYNEMVSLLRSPDAEVRVAAVAGLAATGDPKAQTHIDHQIKHETDPKVIEKMKESLAKVHTKE